VRRAGTTQSVGHGDREESVRPASSTCCGLSVHPRLARLALPSAMACDGTALGRRGRSSDGSEASEPRPDIEIACGVL